jgi:hypothetical protein
VAAELGPKLDPSDDVDDAKDDADANGAGVDDAGVTAGPAGGTSSLGAPHSAQNRAEAISSGAQRWPHSPQNMLEGLVGRSDRGMSSVALASFSLFETSEQWRRSAILTWCLYG